MFPSKGGSLLFWHLGEEFLLASVDYLFDLLVGQLQVEFFIVDAAAAADGLAVFVGLQSLGVVEQSQELICRL